MINQRQLLLWGARLALLLVAVQISLMSVRAPNSSDVDPGTVGTLAVKKADLKQSPMTTAAAAGSADAGSPESAAPDAPPITSAAADSRSDGDAPVTRKPKKPKAAAPTAEVDAIPTVTSVKDISPMYARYDPEALPMGAPAITLDNLCLGPKKEGCDEEAVCELNVMYLELCEVALDSSVDLRKKAKKSSIDEDDSEEKPKKKKARKQRATVDAEGENPIDAESKQDGRPLTYSMHLKACATKIGLQSLSRLLSARCKESSYYKRVAKELEEVQEPQVVTPRRVDRVYKAQILREEEEPPRMVPPADRQIADYGPPRRCGNGCKHYAFGFSVPARNVIDRVDRRKLFGFLPYVPGHFPGDVGSYKSFGYSDEWLTTQLYRHSYFGFTHRRGGWECMRHHEILSHGVIPYFVDLKICPNNVLRTLPKKLMMEAMTMSGVKHVGLSDHMGESLDKGHFFRSGVHIQFRHPATIDFSKFNKTQYYEIAESIHQHVKLHMTTSSQVAYILKTIEYEEPRKVLLVARGEYDYIHQSIEDGLSALRIHTVVAGHDFKWMYRRKIVNEVQEAQEADMDAFRLQKIREHSPSRTVAGLGWVYGFRVDPRFVTYDGSNIGERIKAKEFDLVIFTFTERTSCSQHPYWNEVTNALPKNRRVFIHHDDDWGDPDPGSMDCCHHGFLFKREMKDVGC